MGLGVLPGPPLVRASINPRTTVLLLAVPNSSKVYLEERSEKLSDSSPNYCNRQCKQCLRQDRHLKFP